MAAAGERFQNPTGLGSASAAQLAQDHIALNALHDLARMAANQAFVCARHTVLRQLGDHLEKLRAEGVIEILGWQLLLTRLGQAVSNIGGEFACRSFYNRSCSHEYRPYLPDFPAQRNPAYTY